MSQDSQVYCRTLYTRGNGLALWVPEPNGDLPPEYRTTGIRVGDVGLVTADGCFDFLFNVCVPNDDPINQYNGVPPGFEPLAWDGSTNSTEYDLDIEAQVSMLGLPIGGGGGIGVMFSKEAGAVVMPGVNGADRTDASNKAIFLEYAFRNGESWYRFVNGELGREADNGELYLITGFDKTNSWENAVIYNRSSTNSFSLAFTTGGLGGEGRLRLSKTTSNGASLSHRYPSDESLYNQSLFIRGFRISVRQGVRSRWGSKVKVVSTYRSPQSEALDNLPGGPPFGGLVNRSFSDTSMARYNSFSPQDDTSSSSDSGSEDLSIESATSMEEDDFIPDYKMYHPLVAINDYILGTREDATIAVTHDDDWISLLNIGQDDNLDDFMLRSRLLNQMIIDISDEGYATVIEKGEPLLTLEHFPHSAAPSDAAMSDLTEPKTPAGSNSRDDDLYYLVTINKSNETPLGELRSSKPHFFRHTRQSGRTVPLSPLFSILSTIVRNSGNVYRANNYGDGNATYNSSTITSINSRPSKQRKRPKKKQKWVPSDDSESSSDDSDNPMSSSFSPVSEPRVFSLNPPPRQKQPNNHPRTNRPELMLGRGPTEASNYPYYAQLPGPSNDWGGWPQATWAEPSMDNETIIMYLTELMTSCA
ncbi:SCF ubiquitin ligase complex subunit cdc4 [Marasmius sp. AFHP31]|nr:SCF ubiquitin ligase complex subunit cdc4 [Marasmius sp. AFHP31]